MSWKMIASAAGLLACGLWARHAARAGAALRHWRRHALLGEHIVDEYGSLLALLAARADDATLAEVEERLGDLVRWLHAHDGHGPALPPSARVVWGPAPALPVARGDGHRGPPA